MARYLGLDGCRAGWVVAAIDTEKGITIDVLPSISGIGRFSPFTLALIDIPIGFPESTGRRCDSEARRILAPLRSSSVFSPPTFEAVISGTYEEACARNFEQTGKRISQQAFNIRRKMLEVYEYLIAEKPKISFVQESHPEVCFAALNHWQACKYRKSTTEGMRERLEMISRMDPALGSEAQRHLNGWKPRSEAKPDDILDATVLALAASSASRGRLPENSDMDSRGLPRQIVYPRIEEEHMYAAPDVDREASRC